jgi:hypothetical protein
MAFPRQVRTLPSIHISLLSFGNSVAGASSLKGMRRGSSLTRFGVVNRTRASAFLRLVLFLPRQSLRHAVAFVSPRGSISTTMAVGFAPSPGNRATLSCNSNIKQEKPWRLRRASAVCGGSPYRASSQPLAR